MKYIVWLEFMMGFLLYSQDNPWAHFGGIVLVSSAGLFITNAAFDKKVKE